MSTVSVIIPTYNRARMLRQAIRSVLAQTYRDFEVIVVDDGSTDETADVVRGLCDARIRYFHQANRGISAARNAGIARSQGEFIAFLDSDDAWFPEKLAIQLDALTRHPNVAFVYCAFHRIGPNNEFPYPQDFLGIDPHERVANMYQLLLLADRLLTSSVVVVGDALRKAGGFDEEMRYGEDWDLWIRLSQVTDFCNVGQALAAYRIHAESTTGGDLQGTLDADLRVMDKHLVANQDQKQRDRAEMLSYARHGMEALARGLPEWEEWLMAALDHARELGEPEALRGLLVGNLVSSTRYSARDRVEGARLVERASEAVGSGNADLPRQCVRDYWSTWTHICYKLRDYSAALSCARNVGLTRADRGIRSIAARSAIRVVTGQDKGRTVFPIERELPKIIDEAADGLP